MKRVITTVEKMATTANNSYHFKLKKNIIVHKPFFLITISA